MTGLVTVGQEFQVDHADASHQQANLPTDEKIDGIFYLCCSR